GGTLILDGASSYQGSTEVRAGTLVIDADQSAVTGPVSVVEGAVLGGSGTLGGSLAAAAGSTVAPGGPTEETGIGTLTANGGAVLGGTLAIQLNAFTSDRLVVGGALDIAAATLDLASLEPAAA